MISQQLLLQTIDALNQHNHTLATAESCTGGYLTHLFTQVPQASHYLKGGVIAYQSTIKQTLLQVPGATLKQDGPVSKTCAAAMAEGVRKLLHAHIGIAITGVAGPDPCPTSKAPVGRVWISLATSTTTLTQSHDFLGDRFAIIQQAAQAAVVLLDQYQAFVTHSMQL